MNTEKSIRTILSGIPGVRVKRQGRYWQIAFAWLSGAREDGDELARHLLSRYRTEAPARGIRFEPIIDYHMDRDGDPLPDIPIPEFLFEADPRDAEIQALKAELERAKAHIETVENTPPADLADLIEVADTPIETNDKLLARLREVLGLIGLAEDAGGRAAPELYRRRDRLESGVRWNRGRMAEQL
jgi:hypothetical protein